jgi:DNA-binding SARP family transcriptional activator
MEFRLLGPLDVINDSKAVSFRSSRQRIILATLLLHEGRVVSISRLVDALWGDDPPATAKGQVQTCISAIRRQFRDIGADEFLSTSHIGYKIDLPDQALDITKFERLTSRGRALSADGDTEEAARLFRMALALWRGPVANDVESSLVQGIALRLNEDRLRALEECIELELSLGRHHALVGELSELVREHPLRESFRAQHMMALHRSGRQADALESFREARKVFTDELGLEPSEKLRALQAAILAKDSTLDLRSGPSLASMSPPASGHYRVPRQLPAAATDFTGRQEMLDDLIKLLSGPRESRENRCVPVLCLNGAGGVGKTALALHAAHSVHRLYPDGQLFISVHDADGNPIGPMELMASILGSLGVPQLTLPDNLADRAATYRSWLASRKVLIVLDDVQSASQIAALIPGNPDCAIVTTSRNPLSSLPGGRHFLVEDFDESTSVEFLGKVIGHTRVQAEPAAAVELVTLCDCLPLAVRVVAAKLATHPHWSIHQMILRMKDEVRRLDELALGGTGIRTTLATSYSGLSPAAQRLFTRLSLLGTTDFAFWVCAPLLDMDVDSANDLLEGLVEARLVEVRLNEDGSSRFRLHDLVRIYALERLASDELPSERADAMHRLLSCWLSLAVEAHRRAYGGDYGLHGHALQWSLPADVAERLLASPLSWFRSERAGLVLAVTQAAQVGLDELCWDLAVTAVTLFESDYRVEDWEKTHELALQATRKAKNVRGEAAVLCSLGTLALNGRLKEAPHHLELALRFFDQLDDAHGRALALSSLAFGDRLGGCCKQALARYQEALAGFRRVGDRVSEVDALTNMAQIQMDAENYGAAQRLLDQALAACNMMQAPRVAAQTKHRIGEFYLRTGDPLRAERSFREALQIVRDRRDLVGEAYALAGLGMVWTELGRWELAHSDLSAALNLSRRMTSNIVHGRILLAFAELRLAQADREGATALISEALLLFSENGAAPVWRARFLAVKARIDEQAGNPTAADAARREALRLAGDADPALSRALATTIGVSA